MNKTSVALRDGSGYAGYLETLHMLHCVVSDPHNLSRPGQLKDYLLIHHDLSETLLSIKEQRALP